MLCHIIADYDWRRKRTSTVAASARVALPDGSRRAPDLPEMSPLATAHCIASFAQACTELAALNGIGNRIFVHPVPIVLRCIIDRCENFFQRRIRGVIGAANGHAVKFPAQLIEDVAGLCCCTIILSNYQDIANGG